MIRARVASRPPTILPISPIVRGGFACGGRVKHTGVYKLHKNELVIPAKLVKSIRKMMIKKKRRKIR